MDTSSQDGGPPGAAEPAGVLVERRGPVGWMIFNRPRAGNAMNAAMIDAIRETWGAFESDPDVAVIVVTGAGSAFQTGLDVVQLSREPRALRDMSRRTRAADLQLTAWHCGVTKPVVTAVNGTCAGGGMHFVADSDVVIAASSATFLDPHVSLGQVSALESVGMVRRAAFGAVARMALTGAHERVTAHRAHQLGWVSEVVDPQEQLRDVAQALAERIADNDAAALTATKRALWHAAEIGLTEARQEAAAR